MAGTASRYVNRLSTGTKLYAWWQTNVCGQLPRDWYLKTMHANRLNPENKGDIHKVLRTPRRRCKVPADRAYYIILYPSQTRSTPSYRTVYTHTHTHTHTATLCSTRRQHFPSIQVTRGWVISKAVRVYMRRLHDFLQCFGAVGWAAGKGIRPVKKWVIGCWCGYLSGATCRLVHRESKKNKTPNSCP